MKSKPTNPSPSATADAPSHFEHDTASEESPCGIVFFDGYCGMCNHFVDTLMRSPARDRFRFSPRQGKTFRELVAQFPAIEHCDSIVYWPLGRDQVPLIRSDAVIGIFFAAGGWRAHLAAAMRCFPKPLRDLGYRVVARLRHKISRRRTACRLPTSEERVYFLD